MGEAVDVYNKCTIIFACAIPKLDGGKNVHADGGDADRPLRVCGETEDGKDEQQDARQYPGGVVNHSEESKAAVISARCVLKAIRRRIRT